MDEYEYCIGESTHPNELNTLLYDMVIEQSIVKFMHKIDLNRWGLITIATYWLHDHLAWFGDDLKKAGRRACVSLSVQYASR